MSRALLIGVVAALACGCGNGPARGPEAGQTVADGSRSGAAGAANGAQGQRSTSSADPSVPATSAPPPDQQVSVTGCLTRGEAIATAAPGGSPAGASTAAASTDNGAGANLFVLTHAKPDAGGAGVGANGAGASGGPLLSGVADYRLDGNPAELRSHLNQQVRISARLDPRQTMTSGVRPGSGSNGMMPDAGNPGGRVDRPSGSSSGPEGNRSAAGAASVARLLLVDTIQTVASNCAAQ